MPHLSPERLVALVESGDAPLHHESEHLAQCRHCAGEQAAFAVLLSGAEAERDAIGVPLTDWATLAPALRGEGLIATELGTGEEAARPLATARSQANRGRWMGIAAGIVLFAAGIIIGRASHAIEPPLLAPALAGVPASAEYRQPEALEHLPPYQTVDEALAALERYGAGYQHAAAFLADNDLSTRLDAAEGYRTRLAALERAGRTMREAMEKAPYDPVLTGYYLTTLGEREATLRQLNVAVPAGARLNSF